MKSELLQQEKSKLLLAKACINIKITAEFNKFGKSQHYFKLLILRREINENIKKVNSEIVNEIMVIDCFRFGSSI